MNVNLAIIGGGPAGISAGIYAAMDSADYILIEAKEPCWFAETSVNSHSFVDGFTGVKKNCSGTMLKKSFLNHFKRQGGNILADTVLSLRKKDSFFVLKTKTRSIQAKAVIVTSGTGPKLPKINGIKKFGNNIHFNCVTEGDKYTGKNVVVVGGRNSGAVAACYLHDLGCNVSLIEIKNKLQAKKKYTDRLSEKNIKIYTSAFIEKISGTGKLERVKINNAGAIEEIPTDGIFMYAGRVPSIDFIDIMIKKEKDGYIAVNSRNQTSIAGLYAAGDVTSKLKQIITACGDGANSYYFADKYIKDL